MSSASSQVPLQGHHHHGHTHLRAERHQILRAYNPNPNPNPNPNLFLSNLYPAWGVSAWLGLVGRVVWLQCTGLYNATIVPFE